MDDKMPERYQTNYRKLSRNVLVNRYKTGVDLLRKKKKARPHFHIGDFLNEKIFTWVGHTVDYLFGTKHPFLSYHDISDNGIYSLPNDKADSDVTIALVSDWATDTLESANIAAKIMEHQPGYTIHLGDTYYVGNEEEIHANFLKRNAPWYKGPCGSFALMGNHEMYSMACAYYQKLLPAMGIYDSFKKKYLGQKASYFCLQSTHWLVIALDTGYNSIGFPYVRNSFLTNGKLPDALIHWLTHVVNLQNERRGIVFLSHHQYVSSFKKEKDYDVPAKQLAEIIGVSKKVIWIWGHEHRFAMYGKYKSKKGVTAYGRCIGHGGMPVELQKIEIDRRKSARSKLICYDTRVKGIIDKDNTIGWNGYALLKLEQEKLSLSYYDETKKLLEEKWFSNIHTGEIHGESICSYEDDPEFKLMKGRKIDELIE
jgi:Calcineurin-like phosphoesterase